MGELGAALLLEDRIDGRTNRMRIQMGFNHIHNWCGRFQSNIADVHKCLSRVQHTLHPATRYEILAEELSTVGNEKANAMARVNWLLEGVTGPDNDQTPVLDAGLANENADDDSKQKLAFGAAAVDVTVKHAVPVGGPGHEMGESSATRATAMDGSDDVGGQARGDGLQGALETSPVYFRVFHLLNVLSRFSGVVWLSHSRTQIGSEPVHLQGSMCR